MLEKSSCTLLPGIQGTTANALGVPEICIPWPFDADHSGYNDAEKAARITDSLSIAADYGNWRWPKRPTVFVSDPHADMEGFLRSFVAAGVIKRTGSKPEDFILTDFGQSCSVIVGGDCLDKGPSNLDLLRSLKALIDTGVRVKLLAGNHDLRLLLGVQALTAQRSPLNEHMFIRMGNKVLPLLREVYDVHVHPKHDLKRTPDLQTCRERIFPSEDWYETFPKAASRYLNEAAIAKELRRLRKKIAGFEEASLKVGLDMRMLYAAAMKCNDLFLSTDGEYAWFYEKMQALHKTGSLLFVHAGIDDNMCAEIAERGAGRVNRLYRKLVGKDPFTFYSGSVANLMRTKYRPVDKQLTPSGVQKLHQAGIKLLVHGHINRHQGQRIKTMQGLLHLEGDITLDRHSRLTEGLSGVGTGAIVIYPSGDIVGLSNDFPQAKVFNPKMMQEKGKAVA